MSSSPWGKIQPMAEAVNLQDIMSEELAKDLQTKEDQKLAQFLLDSHNLKSRSSNELEITKEVFENLEDSECCDSDTVIARMLQLQYDKEYDDMLKIKEKKYNGTSKIRVSLANYRNVPEDLVYDDSEEEEAEDPVEKKDWDRFETVEKEFLSIPRCGYKVQGGSVLTKHDMTMAGRRNAGKVMSFPPEFQTGDGAGFDMRLSNKVFNSLKVYSRTEQARRHRIHDKKEDHATAEMGMDETTRLLLYKLINKQLLERVNGVISTGKEAVVLHAESDPAYTECILPKECAIKVFKTTLSEFKQRDKYIKDDFRFKDRFSKQNPRKTIHLWAEKEMHNLMRIHKIGIPCPQVICLKKHILVMSFIGNNNQPALKLKDANLKPDEMCEAYDQVTEFMKKLYIEGQLVHADLSEYNILWHDGKCWFIDVSQAVEHAHPSAYEFLLRDCGNISTFFTRKGVPGVKTANELFVEITGLESATAMETHRSKIKEKPHLVNTPHHNYKYNFDYAWEKSQNTPHETETASIINDVENIIIDPVQS